MRSAEFVLLCPNSVVNTTNPTATIERLKSNISWGQRCIYPWDHWLFSHSKKNGLNHKKHQNSLFRFHVPCSNSMQKWLNKPSFSCKTWQKNKSSKHQIPCCTAQLFSQLRNTHFRSGPAVGSPTPPPPTTRTTAYISRDKDGWGPLTYVYPRYLLCSLGILGDYNLINTTIYRAFL